MGIVFCTHLSYSPVYTVYCLFFTSPLSLWKPIFILYTTGKSYSLEHPIILTSLSSLSCPSPMPCQTYFHLFTTWKSYSLEHPVIITLLSFMSFVSLIKPVFILFTTWKSCSLQYPIIVTSILNSLSFPKVLFTSASYHCHSPILVSLSFTFLTSLIRPYLCHLPILTSFILYILPKPHATIPSNIRLSSPPYRHIPFCLEHPLSEPLYHIKNLFT